jgi:hypothetical protein
VLIVFSFRRESLKLILAMNPFPRWFCHNAEELVIHREALRLIKNDLNFATQNATEVQNENDK